MKTLLRPLLRIAPILACTFVISGNASTQAPATPAAPAEVDMTAGPAPKGKAWEPGWGFWPNVPKAWQQVHQSMVDRTKKGNVKVMFLGDSITAGWAKAGKELWEQNYAKEDAANYGIGGDTTRQILWRIDNGEMDGLNPKLIVLMIGINNFFTNNGTDEEIVKGVGEVIKKIQTKSPASKILLLSILPIKAEPFNGRAVKANPEIAKFAGPKVTWLDLTKDFLGPDGKSNPELYVADGTHLNDKGYAAWAKAMAPTFEKLIKE